MVVLDITSSESHYLQVVRTWLRYRTSAKRERILKVALGFPILAFFIICGGVLFAFAETRLFAPVFIVLLLLASVLVVFSRRFDEWLMIRRLRKSRFVGLRYRIEITVRGLSWKGEHDEYSSSWALFTSALRVHDGVLLYRGSEECYWLPFDCLVEGTPEELQEILQQSISEYRSV